MHLTLDDIAASIGTDPAVKPEDILYKYLIDEATVRFKPLKEHFAAFGLDLTEDEMVRLMAIQEDILFTEGSDDRGRFWRASIVPDQHAGPAIEGYLDHRITDQYDDAMGQDFEGEEDDFAGRELEGINAPPEPGAMNDLNAEGAPGDPGAFDSQPEPPDITIPATDQSEIPPAAVPQAMPDMVAQAMAAQMPDENALEPSIPEPGMVPGPTDQVDMAQAPAQPLAQPGPGEEQPAPQTGIPAQTMAQPQMVMPGQIPGQIVQPQMVQPQVMQPQAMQPQAMQQEPDFGDDGANYTIDPFLNALKGIVNQGETDLPQSPQTTNAPKRYSRRMREAWEKRKAITIEEAAEEANERVR